MSGFGAKHRTVWQAMRERPGTALSHLLLIFRLARQWAEPSPGTQNQAWAPALTPSPYVAPSSGDPLNQAGATWFANIPPSAGSLCRSSVRKDFTRDPDTIGQKPLHCSKGGAHLTYNPAEDIPPIIDPDLWIPPFHFISTVHFIICFGICP